MVSLERWFPTSGRDPNEGRGGSNVGTRDGFMENCMSMIKISKLLYEFKQNDRKNFKHNVVRKGISINATCQSITQHFILYTIKIVYCQGDMFRRLLGHLQAL